jgi:hypothetical protein
LPEVVSAFRKQGANIICTQITRRCHDTPDTIPGRSVLALPSLTQPHELHPSGSACAGTLLIVLRGTGQISVLRLQEHQAAVNDLHRAGHHPLCR